MGKRGPSRGIGGRARKSLVDKIADGNPGKRLLTVSLFALLALVLQDFIPSFDLGRYQEYIDIILVILVGAGVVSNPSIGKGFKDKDVKEKNKGA